MEKIRFRDLSGWLKASIIVNWIMAGLFALSFLVGFIGGMLSV